MLYIKKSCGINNYNEKDMEETFSDLINYFKKIELKLLDIAT